MKNKTILVLSVLSLGILSGACKKDKAGADTLTFPKELAIAKVSAKNDLLLFSNKTEIKDSEIKNRFVNNVKGYFNLDEQPLGSGARMSFLSEDTATFSSSGSKFSIQKDEDLFLFYSKLSIPVPSSYPPTLRDFLKYTYPLSPLPSPGGESSYLTKEVRVGRGSYQELQLAIMGYKLKRGNFSSMAGTVFNEFDRTHIPKLGVNDTLAIREFIITFKAK